MSTENKDPRAAARMELKAMRARIAGMTSAQLKAFFRGFSADDREAFVIIIERLREDEKNEIIRAKQAKIEELQREIAEMTEE